MTQWSAAAHEPLRVASHDLACERAPLPVQTCGVWRQGHGLAADRARTLACGGAPGADLVHHLTVARVAQALGIDLESRQCTVLAEGRAC